MPRQARLDSPGTLHHVIIRGIERRKIVSGDEDREDFLRRMGSVAVETETPIFAWAILPNHVHLLLQSGPYGLPKYMRRLLTGYAVSYNRRHRRYGHLFQNRYKSIICEKEPYFKELLRYIHLNPLRAGLVDSFAKLNQYRWCGHAVLVGKMKNDWQHRDEVLEWFGPTEKEAVASYRKFVRNGISQGRRPELVGGGLVRSMGGWSTVKALRRSGMPQKGDQRILGSGEFVEQMLSEAEEKIRHQVPTDDLLQKAETLIHEACRKEKITRQSLVSGSRLGPVSKVRAELARQFVQEMGLSLAETARCLGVSTSAIAQTLRRKNKYNL